MRVMVKYSGMQICEADNNMQRFMQYNSVYLESSLSISSHSKLLKKKKNTCLINLPLIRSFAM